MGVETEDLTKKGRHKLQYLKNEKPYIHSVKNT